MGKIKKLNPTLIALIAAGEVIQSPRDILKELLENSCDAMATEITVTLLQGGIEKIGVLDNGEGIAADDLELAISPHATSKIVEIRDLNNISSYGFRGEALYTIAAVTNFTLKSRTINDETGRMISLFLNQGMESRACAMQIGTEIVCEQLFAPTPVRRQFLKSPRLEAKRSENMIKNILLLKKDISIKLIANGQLIFQINSGRSLEERIANFFKISQDLIECKSLVIDIGLINCWFYPHHTKGLEQYWYVNDRWISDPIFIRLGQQYFEQGILIVELKIDHKCTDVNVHPQKHIVNISKSESLIASLTEIFLEFNPDYSHEKQEKEEVNFLEEKKYTDRFPIEASQYRPVSTNNSKNYQESKYYFQKTKHIETKNNFEAPHKNKDQFFFLAEDYILISNKNTQLLFNGFEFIKALVELGMESIAPLLLPLEIKEKNNQIFFEKLNIKLINHKLTVFFADIGIYNLKNQLDIQESLTLNTIFPLSWWEKYTYDQIEMICRQSNLFVKILSTTKLINFFLEYE